MNCHGIFTVQLEEIAEVLDRIDAETFETLAESIVDAPRVFLSGKGRSGFVMQGFTMRLMHLGKSAFLLGDPITPPVAADDLLVLGSASGTTSSLVSAAEKSKDLGSRLACVTIDPDSTLGVMADLVVTVPASSPKASKKANVVNSSQPMGTLFEQALALLCDALVVRLMQRINVDAQTMFKRHANVE